MRSLVVVTLGIHNPIWVHHLLRPRRLPSEVKRMTNYGTFTESWLSVVWKLILAVRSSLSQAKR